MPEYRHHRLPTLDQLLDRLTQEDCEALYESGDPLALRVRGLAVRHLQGQETVLTTYLLRDALRAFLGRAVR